MSTTEDPQAKGEIVIDFKHPSPALRQAIEQSLRNDLRRLQEWLKKQ